MKKRLYLLFSVCCLTFLTFTACTTADNKKPGTTGTDNITNGVKDNNTNNGATNGTTGTGTNGTGTTGTGTNGTNTNTNGTTNNGTTTR